MREELPACERAGRTEGLAAGLTRALEGVDVATAAPGTYAAVPEALVPVGATVRTHRLADREGIVFVARPPGRPHSADACARAGLHLAAVRLGLVRQRLDAAVAHLSARTGGGSPLDRKQLVVGTVADTATEIELLRRHLATLRERPDLAEAHARLDRLGWEVARLFGASGYLTDGGARALYVSALAARTWTDEGPEDDRL